MATPVIESCTGRGGTDHCCYLNGVECPFLERNVGGRNFSCSLRRQLGSWAAVDESSEYQNTVAPVWVGLGLPSNYCEIWQPSEGQCCRSNI
jgi:hypothetical protein